MAARVACWSCKQPSSHGFRNTPQRWRCMYCSATNPFDQSVDAARRDSPEVNSQRTARLPQRQSQSTSLQPSNFCRRCENNQNIVRQALANFEPEKPNHSGLFGSLHYWYNRGKIIDAQYQAKTKELEQDWPIECADCSARVSEKIKQANHEALAKMASQKDAQLKAQGIRVWSKKWDVIYWIAGFCWLAVLGIFSVWHTATLVAYPEQYVTIHEANIQNCVTQAWSERAVDSSCVDWTNSWMRLAAYGGLAVMWWNPCMRNVFAGYSRRIPALSTWYKMSVALVLVRFVAVHNLADRSHAGSEDSKIRAVHAVLLVLEVVVSVVLLLTTNIPKAESLLKRSPHSRLEATVFEITQHAEPSPSPLLSSLNDIQLERLLPRTFPLSQLAVSQPSQLPNFPLDPHLSTPPDENAMDIDTPKPQIYFRPSVSSKHEKAVSPFYGKLPPPPMSLERRLRNPPHQPSFRAPSAQAKESFFKSMTGRVPDGDDQGAVSKLAKRQEVVMQQPKFFPPSAVVETGLESMFGGMFSLKTPVKKQQAERVPQDQGVQDSNVEWRHQTGNTAKRTTNRPSRLQPTFRSGLDHISTVVALGIAAWAWDLAEQFRLYTDVFHNIGFGIPTVVAGRGFFISVSHGRIDSAMVFAAEVAATTYFGYVSKKSSAFGGEARETLGPLPLLLIGFLAAHELATWIAESKEMTQAAVDSATGDEVPSPYSPARTSTPLQIDLSHTTDDHALSLVQAKPHTPSPSSSRSSSPTPSHSTTLSTKTPQRSLHVALEYKAPKTRSQAQRDSGTAVGLSGLSLGGPSLIEQNNNLNAMQRKAGTFSRAEYRPLHPWQVGGK